MKPQPSIFAWAAERLAEAVSGPAVADRVRRSGGARDAKIATVAGAVS